MDGLLESVNNAVRIKAADVTVHLIAICPATRASRAAFGETEVKHAIRPDAETHTETANRREIHVEALDGVLDSAAALQIAVLPNRLATMFDGAGDLPQQCGLEW